MPPGQKSLSSPDQVLDMERGKIEIVGINGGGIGRATFQPGWKWSDHERPVVNGSDYCDVPHFVYMVAGSLQIVMADGEEFDLRAGDVATLPGRARRLGHRQRAGCDAGLRRRCPVISGTPRSLVTRGSTMEPLSLSGGNALLR